jgi:hypothetical protein
VISYTAEATCPACPQLFKIWTGIITEDRFMKTSLGEKVGGDVDRYLERERGEGTWLNRSIRFKHSLRLKGDHKEKLDKIIDICGVTKRKENYINLEILIANLLLRRDIRPVSFSLNTLAWKITRYNRAGKGIINIAKKLYEHGYIVLKKGCTAPYSQAGLE